MGNSVLTVENLRKMVESVRDKSIPPFVVASDEEAERFTRDDPTGHVWHKGDRYYLICPYGLFGDSIPMA